MQLALGKIINNKRAIVYLILLMILTVRYLTWLVIYPSFSPMLNCYFHLVNFIYLGGIWEILSLINKKFNKKFPYEQGVIKRILIQSIAGFIITFPLHAFIIVFFLGKITPKVALFPSPVEINTFLIIVSYVIIFIIILAVNLGYFGVHFFNQWKHSITETEKLAKEKALMQKEWATLQLINLQNQLNPHFFFNSITSLQSLIYENQKLAADFLQQLSKVYRYILQNREKELVPLKDELDFVSQYISLLQTRFGESFNVNINVDEEEKHKKIVPVTLQILIENALKHNRMTDEEPLKLEIFTEDEHLIVMNNLQVKKQIENSNKIGLLNMQNLYSFFSERPLTATATSSFFIVKIPLL